MVDWNGAILAILSLIAAIIVGLASLFSLIAPLHPLVWVILGIAFLVGLFWQALKPQRELNALRNSQEKIRALQQYNKLEIRSFRFPWNDAERNRLGITGQNTTRIGIRIENLGDATIVSCSLRLMESHFKDPIGLRDPTIDEWVEDPVGTQTLRFSPEQALPNNPAYSNIPHNGGFAIFDFIRTFPQQIGLHYAFVGQLSDRRVMEGLYCAKLQLEGIIRRGEIETELTPQQFFVFFRYRNRFLRQKPRIVKLLSSGKKVGT